MNTQTQTLNVELNFANLVPIAKGVSQKKDVSPVVVNCCNQRELKYVKDVSCVDQLSFVKRNKCPNCCLKSACRGQTTKLLENLGKTGCWSKSSSNPQRRLHPALSDPDKLGKVTHHHKLLCQSSQKPLPVGGIMAKNAVELVKSQTSLGVFNWLFCSQNPTTSRDLY